MQSWTFSRLVLLLLCSLPLLLTGCDDEAAQGGSGEAHDRGLGGPSVLHDARTPQPPAPDAGGLPLEDAGQSPAPDASAPDCLQDEDCGPDSVCYNDRCVPGLRCAADGSCPLGRLCILDLCVPDPQSTGGLVVEPGHLLFSFSELGEEVYREVMVRNDGDETLTVDSVNVVGSPNFSAVELPDLPKRLVPDERMIFAVRFVANSQQRSEGALEVYSDRPQAPPAIVELASEFKTVGGQDPCLRVVPARLDFGSVPRGRDEVRSFQLISCGDAPLTVQRIGRGVSFFGPLPNTFDLHNPPPFPLVLEPGQTQTIEVKYSPRRAGFEAGFWEVFSNDPQEARKRVDVSALATPPPLSEVDLHIRLTWNTDKTDVDLHLLGPGGQIWTCDGDCFWSNPQPNFGDPNDFRDDPFLDVDDVDGFGPENINLETPKPGTYRVLVHYWSPHDGQNPDAKIEIFERGNLVATYGPQYLSQVNDVWEVVDITWPGAVHTPIEQMSRTSNSNYCSSLF